MDAGIILAAISIVIAVGLPLFLSWITAPRLDIEPAQWAPAGPVFWTFATVRVKNKPLATWMRSVLRRDIAPRCTVTASFQDAPFQPIEARWSTRPQPFRVKQDTDPRTGAPTLNVGYDETMVPETRELDLAPSPNGQEVAVAILRHDGTAYAFSAWSYRHMDKMWADPDLALTKGTTYSVVITASAGGDSVSRTFRLPFMSDDFSKFNLE